jgi:universal stress protein A
MKFDRVLFPVDFSDYSKKCLETAEGLLGKDHPKELHFLHVLRTPTDFAVWQGNPLQEVSRWLGDVSQSFQHGGKAVRKTCVLTGHPATAICQYAAEHNCDAIVMATHGRTGLRHMLIGSTAEQVVRHAPCPVLTLRVDVGKR